MVNTLSPNTLLYYIILKSKPALLSCRRTGLHHTPGQHRDLIRLIAAAEDAHQDTLLGKHTAAGYSGDGIGMT